MHVFHVKTEPQKEKPTNPHLSGASRRASLQRFVCCDEIRISSSLPPSPCEMDSSVAWSTFTLLCDHHHLPSPELSSQTDTLSPWNTNSPFSTLPSPWHPPPILPSVSVNLAALGPPSREWSHAVSSQEWPLSLSMWWQVSGFPSLLRVSILLCVCESHTIYPFLYWWARGLLVPLGCRG